ncbi:4308_t:CDS:1, partial [Racocetra fulgida]
GPCFGTFGKFILLKFGDITRDDDFLRQLNQNYVVINSQFDNSAI